MKRLLQLLAMAMIAIPVLAQQLTPEEAMMRVKRVSAAAQDKATKSQTRKLVYTI